MRVEYASLVLFLCGTLAISESSASGTQDIYAELQQLRNEVELLRVEVRSLTEQMSYGNQRHGADNHQWGCYMNDLTAGGISSTASTEAEAKGIALEKCSQKQGTCFESNLKCSKN